MREVEYEFLPVDKKAVWDEEGTLPRWVLLYCTYFLLVL